MPHRPHTSVVLEPEYIEGFRQIYEEKIVFNQILGLKLVKVSPEGVQARIDMRPELVGHYAYNRIHGGVISAVLGAGRILAVICSASAKAVVAAVRMSLLMGWSFDGGALRQMR